MMTIIAHALFLVTYGFYMTYNPPSCQREPDCSNAVSRRGLQLQPHMGK